VVRLYERAIELDPQFARAYEGLAAASVVTTSWGYDDRDYDAMVLPAAARALELDPTLSMPWAARSMVLKRQWPVDFAAVLAGFDKAIAADPRNPTAVFWRGIAWIDMGYFDRAIADLDRCLALEPGYHNCRSHKAVALLFKGDEDAAFAVFERTVHDDAFLSRNDHFVWPLWRHGNRTAAMLLLDANDLQPGLRAAIVAGLENPGTANPNAKALVADHLAHAHSAVAKAVVASRIHHWLSDFDGVAAHDDIAIDQMIAWERDPPAWRNSPQMKGKLVRMGAVAYWRKQGFPPQCRAVGKDDFTCD
jgi:tetratricopeptide (TPR) repeat protein